MPELASLNTTSPLSASVSGNTGAASQPSDSGANDAFSATLARQTTAPAAAQAAEEPAAEPARAQNAAARPEVGIPLTLAAALALTGNGNLPVGGKTLPVAAADDAASAETATSDVALDPALMLMLNASVQPVATQPVATPAQSGNAPAARNGAALFAQASAPASAQQTGAPQTGAPQTGASQTAAAQLAVSADPALARAANAAAITIAPDAENEAAAPDANAIALRPVALAAQAAQPKAQGEASGQQSGHQDGASQNSASPDPLALAATEDARLAPPPTPGLAEASASAVPSSLSGATAGGAVNPMESAKPAAGTDMAALVDRLVEARQAARMSGPQSVVASIAHSDFGRVSLNFQQDDSGLSVSMASADPAFAPAAQAALAQQAAQASQINASSTGNDTNANSNNGQSSANQSERRDAFLSQGNAQQSSGQSGNPQQSRSGDTTRRSTDGDIAANTAPMAEGTATTLSRRSGILA